MLILILLLLFILYFFLILIVISFNLVSFLEMLFMIIVMMLDCGNMLVMIRGSLFFI